MVFGRYKGDDVTTVWRDQPRRTTPEIEEAIAQTWDTESAAAVAQGRKLYNGEMARLIQLEARKGRLRFHLGPTCYRDFVGTNFNHASLVSRHGHDCFANPVGISATPITRDGFILYGRRNDRVMFHAGYLHTIGGSLEPPDRLPSGGYDLFGAAMRELCEELAVTPDEVEELVCTGIVRDTKIVQPEVLFDAELTLTRDEVLQRFDPNDPDQEHTGIEYCPDEPEDVLRFLKASEPVAPVCEGALMLHGRHAWSEEWYEQTCGQRYACRPATVARASPASQMM